MISQTQKNRIEKLVRENGFDTVRRQYQTLLKKCQKLCVYRHADSTGHVRCFTCDKSYVYNDRAIQGGHFIGRDKKPTSFLQINLKPQCWPCNGPAKKGNHREYEKRLDDVYVRHLESLADGPQPFMTADKHDAAKLFAYMVLVVEPKVLFHTKRLKSLRDAR